MPFVLLLILALTCLEGTWPQPPAWLGPFGIAALTWGGACLLGLVPVLAGRLPRRGEQRTSARTGNGGWRRLHFLLLVVFFVVVLFGGWAWTARSALSVDRHLLPGTQVVLLSPLLFALAFTWACDYDLYRRSHRRTGDTAFPSRWAYVALQARHHLLLVLPALLLITLQQAMVFVVPGLGTELLFALLTMALVVAVLLLIPWILRVALGLQPLPAGPVRTRLEALARRLNCRCSDILLWRTHDSLANAMVTGALPWLRYVIITDRLADHLTTQELEAVFGHEVSHVRNRHMLYYMGFVVVSLALGWSLWQVAGGLFAPQLGRFLHERIPSVYEFVTSSGIYEDLLLLGLLSVEIAVLFGYISRRCERQADVDGCRAVSCAHPLCIAHEDSEELPANGSGLCATGIRTFISALEKVAWLNGINRERPGFLSSWQHSTIAKRVQFLERLGVDPREEYHLHRSVRMIQWGILLGLVVVVVLAPFV
jgi:STE24 endopeptidase